MRFLRWAPQAEPPVGARLWTAHPLCQNLLCAFWFNEYSNLLENKANGEMAEYINFIVSLSNQTSDFGVCYEFPNTSNRHVLLPYWPPRDEISTGFTLQARVLLSTDTDRRVIYNHSDSFTTFKSLSVEQSTRKLRYSLRAFSTDTYVETSSLTVPLNQWVNVGVSVSHSGEIVLMMDGFTETFTVSGINSITGNPVSAIGGIRDTIFNQWHGQMDHFWMWNIVIPFADLRDLRAFPYILNPPLPFHLFGDALTGIATSMSVDAWVSRKQQVVQRKRVMHSRHSLSWNVLPPPIPAAGYEAFGAYVTPLDYGAEVRSI